MARVLLIHAGKIPHYRVPIYSYLASYLMQFRYTLSVISDGIQPDNPHPVDFDFTEMRLSTMKIIRFISKNNIDIIIDYMELRHLYLFPTYFISKGIMRKKILYWGQGRDLLDSEARVKNLAYMTEQAMSDAIVLYAEHLKQYIPKGFHRKTFIANNTLCVEYDGIPDNLTKNDILKKYGINTKKNIICMGRMQKRKRIDILIKALELMNRQDVGLILVGPDTEGILDEIKGENIYKLGPVYGQHKYELLEASDVFCLPSMVYNQSGGEGWGLVLNESASMSLPIITTDAVGGAPDLVKDGFNGYIVKNGDVEDLYKALKKILSDEGLMEKMGKNSREIFEDFNDYKKVVYNLKKAIEFVER